MKLRKRLIAGLLSAIMAVSTVPAGVSAETNEGEWTDDENTLIYTIYSGISGGCSELYSDHAEHAPIVPVMHIDDRETELGALTGNNSLLITADQLKSDKYTDKVALGFTLSFENHLNLTPNYNFGEVSLLSVDGSFASTELIIGMIHQSIGKALYSITLTCKKEDLQSGIMIRLTEENKENEYNEYNTGINRIIRSGNPLHLRTVNVNNIYNYEKKTTLEGISGDLDALGSITIPASMLADYPVEDENRPGALLCFEYEPKSDASSWVGLTYYTGELENAVLLSGLSIPTSTPFNLVDVTTNQIKTDGLTVKYSDDDSHGAILKSVSVYLPIGVTYPIKSGYQSIGESIAALGTGKTVAQKTSVKDGKYDARFVEKVNVSELSGKSKAVFSLSNGTKTSSVSTNKYYTSLTADGETISAGSGYVFLVYTLSGIPEDVNVTVTGVTLE